MASLPRQGGTRLWMMYVIFYSTRRFARSLCDCDLWRPFHGIILLYWRASSYHGLSVLCFLRCTRRCRWHSWSSHLRAICKTSFEARSTRGITHVDRLSLDICNLLLRCFHPLAEFSRYGRLSVSRLNAYRRHVVQFLHKRWSSRIVFIHSILLIPVVLAFRALQGTHDRVLALLRQFECGFWG